jgi:hypothetical protein
VAIRRKDDIGKLVPGQDATKAIAALYEHGRIYPRGKPPIDTFGRSDSDAKLPKYGGGDGLALPDDAKVNPQANQDPQDKHGPQYDCEPSIESWLRGGNGGPTFDRGPSGYRYHRK